MSHGEGGSRRGRDPRHGLPCAPSVRPFRSIGRAPLVCEPCHHSADRGGRRSLRDSPKLRTRPCPWLCARWLDGKAGRARSRPKGHRFPTSCAQHNRRSGAAALRDRVAQSPTPAAPLPRSADPGPATPDVMLITSPGHGVCLRSTSLISARGAMTLASRCFSSRSRSGVSSRSMWTADVEAVSAVVRRTSMPPPLLSIPVGDHGFSCCAACSSRSNAGTVNARRPAALDGLRGRSRQGCPAKTTDVALGGTASTSARSPLAFVAYARCTRHRQARVRAERRAFRRMPGWHR